jgi:hypothetical protein
MSPRYWTTAEDRMLREWYGRVGPRETARMIGRSVTAVYSRAWVLGLCEKDPRRAQRFHPMRMAT